MSTATLPGITKTAATDSKGADFKVADMKLADWGRKEITIEDSPKSPKQKIFDKIANQH